MIKRALLRIATTQAAYFAASVFPAMLLLAFVGTELLPVREVVRIELADKSPGTIDSAVASIRNAFPSLSVEQRFIGGHTAQVTIERPLSLVPGGSPPLEDLVKPLQITTAVQHVSLDLVASEIGDTFRDAAAIAIASTASLLLVFALVLIRRCPVSAPRLGVAGIPRTILASALAWVCILLLGWIVGSLPEPWPSAVDPQDYSRFLSAGAMGLLVACVMVPTAEELLFRRWLYVGLLQDRVPFAIALQALLFAAPHFLPLGLRGVVAAFCMGIVLAWLYRMTGRIEAPILVHIAQNSLAVFVSR